MRNIIKSIVLVAVIAIVSCEREFKGTEYVAPYYKMGATVTQVDRYMNKHAAIFEKEVSTDEGDKCGDVYDEVLYWSELGNMGLVRRWKYRFSERGLIQSRAYIKLDEHTSFDSAKFLKGFKKIDTGSIGENYAELFVDSKEKVVVVYCKIKSDEVAVGYYDRLHIECVEGCSYRELLKSENRILFNR